jgi:lycopene cyclase domain-containing protein
VRHLSYLAVLAACLLGTAPLEILLRTRVYARWRRLAATLVPVLVVFTGWDLYAVARHQWTFDPRGVLGVRLPGGLPVEEVLFFVAVPICAVLTLEAVRARRPGWLVGDEAAATRPKALPVERPEPESEPEPLVGEPAGDERVR